MRSKTYGLTKNKLHKKLRIWSYLLNKSVVKTFIFCAVHNRANKRLTYLASSTLSFFIFHLLRELFMSVVLQRCAGCAILQYVF